MNYKCIKLDLEDGLAIITLNQPEVYNAISTEMVKELKDAVTSIAAPGEEIRCLLITGSGKGFCSGANLAEIAPQYLEEENHDLTSNLDSTYHPLFLKLKDLKIPVITAVNGAAVGIGMSLALAGDIVLAARSSYFLQAFRNVGLVADGGITWILPRLIGMRRAMAMSMLAEKLPAEQALEWGLITRVLDDIELMPEAMKLARDLATGPTKALGLIRQANWQSLTNSFEQHLHFESEAQNQVGWSQDFLEGLKAFQERRRPQFTGQ